MSEIRAALLQAKLAAVPGLLVEGGRIVSVSEGLGLFDGAAVHPVPEGPLIADLEDAATWCLCLRELCARVGLPPDDGVLWYLDQDEATDDWIWVLEGQAETRHRPGDTDDPRLALDLGLQETAHGG